MTLRRRGYRTPSKYKGLSDVQWRILRLTASLTKRDGVATAQYWMDWNIKTVQALESRGFIEQATPQKFDHLSRPTRYRTTDIGMAKAIERGPLQ